MSGPNKLSAYDAEDDGLIEIFDDGPQFSGVTVLAYPPFKSDVEPIALSLDKRLLKGLANGILRMLEGQGLRATPLNSSSEITGLGIRLDLFASKEDESPA